MGLGFQLIMSAGGMYTYQVDWHNATLKKRFLMVMARNDDDGFAGLKEELKEVEDEFGSIYPVGALSRISVSSHTRTSLPLDTCRYCRYCQGQGQMPLVLGWDPQLGSGRRCVSIVSPRRRSECVVLDTGTYTRLGQMHYRCTRESSSPLSPLASESATKS